MQIISSRRMSCTRDTSLDFSNPGPGFCPACGVVGDNPPDHCLWNFLPFSADSCPDRLFLSSLAVAHDAAVGVPPVASDFELVFVSRNPPDSSKEICYGDLVTEILLRRSCYGDSVTATPAHFNPYRFRQTLSTTHRRLIPCKGYLNTLQT